MEFQPSHPVELSDHPRWPKGSKSPCSTGFHQRRSVLHSQPSLVPMKETRDQRVRTDTQFTNLITKEEASVTQLWLGLRPGGRKSAGRMHVIRYNPSPPYVKGKRSLVFSWNKNNTIEHITQWFLCVGPDLKAVDFQLFNVLPTCPFFFHLFKCEQLNSGKLYARHLKLSRSPRPCRAFAECWCPATALPRAHGAQGGRLRLGWLTCSRSPLVSPAKRPDFPCVPRQNLLHVFL